MRRVIFFVLAGMVIASGALPASAALLSERLAGRILLQVEQKGKAWYIDPLSHERAYLGRPEDAFRIMREMGLGITNTDLEKVSKSDTVSTGDTKIAKKLAGKILLQVQSKGEAWYINPINLKRYYLGRPADAFSVMRGLGLGISNDDLGKVAVLEKYRDSEQTAVTAEQAAAAEEVAAQKTPPAEPSKDFSTYAGSYRCWSYNVSGGGGGNCRLFAPIVLNKDGTYSVSSEKGTFTVSGDTIILSESKIRGPGKLSGGTQIRFEYDYNNWHHVITYLKEGGVSSSAPNDSVSEIPVQVILQYPAKDSALNGIVTVELVPEGQDVKTARYKPTAIAVWDGDKRVTASFHKATNTPQAGKKYTVYTNTGNASTTVGALDLTNATKELTVTINVSTGKTEQEAVQRPEGPEIVVEIDLVYPARDGSLGSIQFIVLVPEGEDPAVAVYKPTALAVWDGDKTIVGSFHKATNQVKTKAKYTVYADWGVGGMVKSGTLDLSAVTSGPLKKTFQTTIGGSASGASSGASGSSSSESSSTSSSSSTPPYVSVNLILQYAAGDQSLHNVTRIGMVKQGEVYYSGYGNLAGYGASQQLTAEFPYSEPGFVYDIYTDSYTAGSKKVGIVDMRGVSANTTKTVSVQ